MLAELDFLLMTRIGSEAESRFLDQVGAGVYRLESFAEADIRECADLVRRYSDMEIGLADASVVVLASRYRTTRVLTLDERHFRAIRPMRGNAFKLLPADA